MRSTALFGIALLIALGLFALGEARVNAEDAPDDAPADWSKRAIQAWGKTCRKCHAAPDKRYETDRAFLGQIMETT